MKISAKKKMVYLGVPVLVTLTLKSLLILINRMPFNADEAIVALMARHILQGDFPAFFYGQSYMGSLDAFFVSIGFLFFGEKVWVIRLVQSLLYAGTVATTAELARQLFSDHLVGFYAGLLAAVPVVNVTLYTTVSLGGYGEALLIGNLLLLLALFLSRKVSGSDWSKGRKHLMIFVWGVLAGIGFWVMGLTLIYTVAGFSFLIWMQSERNGTKEIVKSFLTAAGGLIAGASPWWITALNAGITDFVLEMFGSAVSVSQLPIFLLPFQRAASFLLFGGTVILGMRPPWSVTWLMLPMIPGILIFWFAVMYKSLKSVEEKEKGKQKLLLLLGPIFILALAFVFTSFGSDPSGRYFIPFVVPMAIIASHSIKNLDVQKVFWRALILGLVILFNLGGTIQCLIQYPPGLTTQFDQAARIDHHSMDDLILFLSNNDLKAGYTNYWVAYPLAFRSNETLIYLPELPYHHDFRYTERDNRYSPYREVVESAESLAYIVPEFPALEEYIRDSLVSLDISWSEHRIGDYLVFYDLNQPIRPDAIGLGKTTNP